MHEAMHKKMVKDTINTGRGETLASLCGHGFDNFVGANGPRLAAQGGQDLLT